MMKTAEDKGWGVDEWSGDWECVEGIFPTLANEPIDKSRHEHIAACGGYYQHTHRGGRLEHQHTHEQCQWCRT